METCDIDLSDRLLILDKLLTPLTISVFAGASQGWIHGRHLAQGWIHGRHFLFRLPGKGKNPSLHINKFKYWCLDLISSPHTDTTRFWRRHHYMLFYLS